MTNRFLQWSDSLGRTPVVPLIGHPGAPLTGTSLKQNLTSSEVQTASLKALEETVAPDALFFFMDLTVEAEALGCGIDFPHDRPPSVRHHPYVEEADLDRLPPWEGLVGRMGVFVDTVKKSKSCLNVPLGVYTIGPFTLASQLMGVENICVACAMNPDLVLKFVEKATAIVTGYATALVEAGADVYCMLEPSAALISARHFKRFSGPFCREVFEQTAKAWSILHICGKTSHLLKEMVATEAEGLSLDSDVSFPELAKTCPDDVVLIGNVNPVQVMQQTPEEVRQAVLDLRHSMKSHKNFVLSTGCDLPMETPLENAKAFVAAGREPLEPVTIRP
jgi:uroporphyrinogen decarboxylase